MGLFSKYTLKHKTEGETLKVSYSGKLTKKEMDEIMEKITILVKHIRPKKILIDARESDLHLELNESLSMANQQAPEYKNVKTAIVERKEKEAQYKMFEMFVENRDFPMQFFNSVEDAEKWLAE
jgi:hypothetical protein